MEREQRPSPKGKRVSLFVTCIVDQIYPQTGMSVVEVLERLGVAVDFPQAQTCCGQMGFNAGYRDEATAVAKHFIETFESAEVIVAPSGSCVAMVRHFYPELLKDDPQWSARMERIVSRTWELTEYLVDGLGIVDVGARLAQPLNVAVHDACHGLRGLNLRDQPRALLQNIGNLQMTELEGANQCCGFGGLFAIKMPDVSGAILNDKIRNIEAADADVIVTCDVSCMTQMNGGLSRQGVGKRVCHIADLLAGRMTENTNA
jgi:L-lactate dehydrogenase complex protein LldE